MPRLQLLLVRTYTRHHGLMIPDADHIALLDPLDRERGDERRADAAPVLRGPDVDPVGLAVAPAEDLAQRLRAARLEVRVLVEDRAVGADVALAEFLLDADGGGAAGRQAGCARADEDGEVVEKLGDGLGDV